jgi:hypothetical protein
MLIEFLRLAVNLTPSLKSPSIPQTPTHRLPEKVEKSSDESAATGMYVGAVNKLRKACRGIDIRFPASAKVFFFNFPPILPTHPPIQRVTDALPTRLFLVPTFKMTRVMLQIPRMPSSRSR